MGVLRAEQVQLAGCDPAQQPTSQAPEQGALDGGPSGPLPNVTSNLWLQQSQAQMEEVVSIMRVNVDKVLDRDIRLTEMDSKADALETDASVFKTSAGWLKRKYWWKNCKVWIVCGCIQVKLGFIRPLYFVQLGLWLQHEAASSPLLEDDDHAWSDLCHCDGHCTGSGLWNSS
nr:vesicle-associated membrane protein 1 isoform X5 [Pelodiscus sinensis]|eukprot:XP_025040988.1 vesicle-associated membrane protein 1 isoform X5 [Pelodiscus sinensis]